MFKEGIEVNQTPMMLQTMRNGSTSQSGFPNALKSARIVSSSQIKSRSMLYQKTYGQRGGLSSGRSSDLRKAKSRLESSFNDPITRDAYFKQQSKEFYDKIIEATSVQQSISDPAFTNKDHMLNREVQDLIEDSGNFFFLQKEC